MNNLFDNKTIRRIHFIGVGGISMSALATHLSTLGYVVSGSDKTESQITARLKSAGVKIYIGHSAKNVEGADAIVYSSAISKSNPEYAQAKALNLKLYKRSFLLGKIISGYNNSIGVAGSHGKTTSTALIAKILIANHLSPTVFLGGEEQTFYNYKSGKSDYIVSEVCEYDKSINDITLNYPVLLNIDNDHQDSYSGIEELKRAFKRFLEGKQAFVNIDDDKIESLKLKGAITFGLTKKAQVRAKYAYKRADGGYTFTLYINGQKIDRINLGLLGKHNIYNALSAISVCAYFGVPIRVIKKQLEKGVKIKRRNEVIGKINGKLVIADYAHHPEEIKKSVECYGEKALYVFQPHTYSRTKYLFEDFILALSKTQNLIIYKTYPAREKFDKFGDAKLLYKTLKKQKCLKCYYADNSIKLNKLIKRQAEKTDKILIVGAGDIYQKIKCEK